MYQYFIFSGFKFYFGGTLPSISRVWCATKQRRVTCKLLISVIFDSSAGSYTDSNFYFLLLKHVKTVMQRILTMRNVTLKYHVQIGSSDFAKLIHLSVHDLPSPLTSNIETECRIYRVASTSSVASLYPWFHTLLIDFSSPLYKLVARPQLSRTSLNFMLAKESRS